MEMIQAEATTYMNSPGSGLGLIKHSSVRPKAVVGLFEMRKACYYRGLPKRV
jgi:hypothetical protein